MQNNALIKRIIIGLGSNQDALKNLRKTLLELRRIPLFKILKVSRIYESNAQLPENAPAEWNQAYLNAAVLIEVQNFDPMELLQQLKKVEIFVGRIQSEKWAPRVIDLDILYVEDFNYQNENLTIPHPLLAERAFAFLPALEVLPSMTLIKKNNQDFETKVSNQFFWPEFVGILNVTPDSFSDGGKYLAKENFLAQARKLILSGADYLDLGAESTRPQAVPVSLSQEWMRLERALNHLMELKKEGLEFKISVDSRHYETLLQVVQNYKIDLINDVSGLNDERIFKLIKAYNLAAVCMHSLSVPARKDIVLKAEPHPVDQLKSWWLQKENLFSIHDVQSENIFFDPGFGFGKTPDQNHYLIDHLEDLRQIRNKFFLGYSRKSFLGNEANRDVATAAITQQIIPAFCQFLRVHDIEAQKRVLNQSHGL